LIFLSFSIPQKIQEGIYEYKSGFFYEKIELKKNFKFKYEYHTEFIQSNLVGNYRIKGDSLILDSSPQRDKIIVKESLKGNLNRVRFSVTDKKGVPMNYHLYIITKSNDTIILKDQFIKSKLKCGDLKSFYIFDTKGLKSPTYDVVGLRTNYFEVQFETNRVLDNEIWVIDNNRIYPKGLNGEKQNYCLTKRIE
jgi:hypothetical protein